jgi:fucose permease
MQNAKCKMLASAIAGQWIFGIILALLGQLFGIPAATEHLHLDLPAQARLLLTLFTGQLLFTAAVGRIVDRIGSTRVLGTGSLLMSAAVFLLALAPGFGQAAVAALIMSLGGACVNAAANTLVSTVYGNLRGPMLNVLGVFGAAGAVSVPLAFSGATTYPHVRGRLIALAAACGSIGVLQLLQPAPQSDVPGQPAPGVSRAVPRDPWLLALVVVLVIDFGAEAVMAGWIAPYTLAAVPLASPTTMLGFYWGALASGRMLMPLVLARTTKLVLLATAASVAALGLLAISAVRTPLSLALCVAVTGLTLSPMAPTTLSVAGTVTSDTRAPSSAFCWRSASSVPSSCRGRSLALPARRVFARACSSRVRPPSSWRRCSGASQREVSGHERTRSGGQTDDRGRRVVRSRRHPHRYD